MPQRHGKPTEGLKVNSEVSRDVVLENWGIRLEHLVTYKEITEKTGMRPIVEEVKKRRWKWLGHLRIGKSRDPLIALAWNQLGTVKKGIPQGTWRRSVESERLESGKTWNELNWLP
ncbi:endonuclease-reverse transcriptase [Elysia marginata]|uniref:Endonuclease-reverse transcriptase n=1 Tax=Elysia marginata TaxID=1093978 RepID=A0AAV4JZ64_9GAST|nr:endonuclease-reverse transcriptase [Elysia marginata]